MRTLRDANKRFDKVEENKRSGSSEAPKQIFKTVTYFHLFRLCTVQCTKFFKGERMFQTKEKRTSLNKNATFIKKKIVITILKVLCDLNW